MPDPQGRHTKPNTSEASRIDAIALHHLAHKLYTAGIPIIPRLIDYLIFLLFNSVIPHTARIGEGTRCGYRGMSVLVHSDAVIGRHVMLGAHVVIGGRSEQPSPVIEDGVYIGANACVLGGIRVGRDAVIGAGAVVINDVPPGARAVGDRARILDEPPSDSGA
jgi:serine O-acetyltransferase